MTGTAAAISLRCSTSRGKSHSSHRTVIPTKSAHNVAVSCDHGAGSMIHAAECVHFLAPPHPGEGGTGQHGEVRSWEGGMGGGTSIRIAEANRHPLFCLMVVSSQERCRLSPSTLKQCRSTQRAVCQAASTVALWCCRFAHHTATSSMTSAQSIRIGSWNVGAPNIHFDKGGPKLDKLHEKITQIFKTYKPDLLMMQDSSMLFRVRTLSPSIWHHTLRNRCPTHRASLVYCC